MLVLNALHFLKITHFCVSFLNTVIHVDVNLDVTNLLDWRVVTFRMTPKTSAQFSIAPYHLGKEQRSLQRGEIT